MSHRRPALRPDHHSRGHLDERSEPDPTDLANIGAGIARHGEYAGLRALMLAILEDGIRSYLGGSPRIRREAECWVMTRAPRSPFAFTVVCETLGLEPDAVLAALRRAQSNTPSSRSPVRRSRPNVRRTTRLATRKTE